MGKKTRPEAKLKLLPEAVQIEIVEHARKPGMTLAETCAWVAETHQVKVSPVTLSRFLAARRDAEMQERVLASITAGSRLVQDMERQFGKTPAPDTENLIKFLRVLILQLSAQGACDAEFLKAVGPLMGSVLEAERLSLKREEVALAERRVKLLEEKAARADAAEKVAVDGALSAEEKLARMREIFGIANSQ